jgi:hypothetical protein
MRNPFRSWATCAASLVFLLPALAAGADDLERTVSVAAPAAWVREVPAGSLAQPTQGRDAGVVVLLVDSQWNVATGERYRRVVYTLRTADGVQDWSTITADYDPSFQALVFHHVTITRGATVANRLQRREISLLHREKGMEEATLDGTVTASIVLADVRPGDTVDYAYTTRGSNPALGGKFVGVCPKGYSSAVGRQRLRILRPAARALQWRAIGGAGEPRVETSGGVTESLWDWKDLAPLVHEDGTPFWHVTQPLVEVSEFHDWGEVAGWAAAFYPPAALSPELEALCAGWQGGGARAEARLRRALDFVQQQVRYLGIEMGVGSYRPRAPVAVAAARFGDCKDKAYLLCTLLRRMGIDARPVLVDAWGFSFVRERLPSPLAFDHVIVAATVGGRTLYVDPTRAWQRGPVDERLLPAYGAGLDAAAGRTGLVDIPASVGRGAETEEVEKLTVRGKDESADLTVETTVRGTEAEEMRAYLAGRRTDEVDRSYRDFYAEDFPGITLAGTLQVRDDEEANVITTVEHYSIPGFWKPRADGKTCKAGFFARSTFRCIPLPRTKVRTTPLAVGFPVHFRERVEMTLPEPWPDRPESTEVKTAAFVLATRKTFRGKLLVLEYDYRSTAREVAVADMPAYNRAVQDIDENLGITLTWNPGGGGPGDNALDMSALLVMILSVLLSGGAATALYRFAARPAAGAPMEAALSGPPRGLGGFLVVAAIGIFANALMAIIELQKSWPLFTAANWYDLTSPAGARYRPGWLAYMVFLIAGNAAVVIGSVLVAILFFQRRRRFPPTYIGYLVLIASLNIAGTVFEWQLAAGGNDKAASGALRALVQSAASLAIWIPYMLRSLRVKNTFVR